ncbi:unnamed protein product, partial [marine sediment metagenome]
DYSDEVSAIYRQTSEELEHIFGELNHGEPEEEVEAEGALITSLEEAADVVLKACEDLEKVKVPDGLEDLHKESLAFFEGVALSYEQLVAFIEPEEHHEEEAHDQEEHQEEPGESEEHE